VRIGDSIAVNGTCLTVTRIDAGRLHFDAVRETLERTALAISASARA
jgi:riboflavin synthase